MIPRANLVPPSRPRGGPSHLYVSPRLCHPPPTAPTSVLALLQLSYSTWEPELSYYSDPLLASLSIRAKDFISIKTCKDLPALAQLTPSLPSAPPLKPSPLLAAFLSLDTTSNLPADPGSYAFSTHAECGHFAPPPFYNPGPSHHPLMLNDHTSLLLVSQLPHIVPHPPPSHL